MCSLHLKAFQALRIVFCHNNGLVVYSWGSSDAQTYKQPPTPPRFSRSPLSAWTLCLQRKSNYGITTRKHPWEKKVKTHYLYYCWTTNVPITTHRSTWLQIYFLWQCVCRVSKLLSRTTWLINKCPYGQPGPSTVWAHIFSAQQMRWAVNAIFFDLWTGTMLTSSLYFPSD